MSDFNFRAISTRYKGYNFRSRLEARWAVFFDHLGIEWEYEPEGFELGNGLRYLPDFWLPQAKLWIEIKPGPLDDAAREKAWRLALHHGHAIFASKGLPDRHGTFLVTHTQTGGEVGVWALETIVFWHKASWRSPTFIFCAGDVSESELARIDQDTSGVDLIVQSSTSLASRLALVASGKALDAARAARFEFGQEGA